MRPIGSVSDTRDTQNRDYDRPLSDSVRGGRTKKPSLHNHISVDVRHALYLAMICLHPPSQLVPYAELASRPPQHAK
jgi:hypothetical protein